MPRQSRKEREQDLERELQSHLELAAAEHEENGLSGEEAVQAARRAFGNATRVKEQAREMWGWTLWRILAQDLRHAARTLRKTPGFALTAILTLALGIGASTAVFTVVDSVLLKPLAYRDSGSLVAIWEYLRFGALDRVGPNPRHADFWQKERTVVSGLALLRESSSGLSVGAGHPRPVGTVTCSANLLDVLQVTPALGRGFLPEEDVAGRDNVVILTWSLWQSVFRGDPNIVGKTIRLADIPRVVIGVLPASFRFPDANALRAFSAKAPISAPPEPSVFVPAALNPNQYGWMADFGNWVALARLKPGVGIVQAEAQLGLVEGQIIRETPAETRVLRPGFLHVSVQPMQEAVVGDSGTAIWLLMAAVTGLMLIACLNLASAQLGRSQARQREAAVRVALGGPGWRLLWHSLSENLLLAAVGGSAGIGLAAAGLALFRHYSPVDLPRLAEVHLNVTVLLFAVVLTVGSSFLFGVLPALKLMRTDPQASLQQSDGRTLGFRQGGRLRTWLMSLQVLGSTALLVVTGLFANSLIYLLQRDKGFETGNVVIAEAQLPGKAWTQPQSRIAFDDAVLNDLRAVPGVLSAALVNTMPLEGETWIEQIQRPDKPDLGSVINLRWVSPGYFEALQEKLVAGRFMEERDRDLNSAVLSEGLAKTLWPNENPIGAQVTTEGRKFSVIGVVADSRATSLKSAPPRMAYLHYKDRPPFSMVFIARSNQSTEQLLPIMRETIWRRAPEITISRVKTLDSQLSDSLAGERFQTLILAAFGISALLLAMLGIYGVLNYSLISRMREIGVRIALGASRSRIYAIAAGEAGAPVFAGLAGGLILGVLAARVIRKLLYGTEPVNSSVILIVVALFLVAAIAAVLLPARRAAALDPMETLRSD